MKSKFIVLSNPSTGRAEFYNTDLVQNVEFSAGGFQAKFEISYLLY
jgi:hypothetical protein